MHLVIAMIILYNKFGDRITVTGGDTDSLKIRCDFDISDDDLIEALKPLHDAIGEALSFTMQRVRKLYPNLASNLEHIGEFECEKCHGFNRYKYHMEGWNKARISIAQDNSVHVTCAGLSRPIDKYHIENFISDLLKKYSVEDVLLNILGYNVFVTHDICYALEHKKPKCDEMFYGTVTDYLGNTYNVCQTQAIALYDSGRMLGDTSKRTNADNLRYLRQVQNLDIDDSQKWLQIKDNKPQIVIGGQVEFEG